MAQESALVNVTLVMELILAFLQQVQVLTLQPILVLLQPLQPKQEQPQLALAQLGQIPALLIMGKSAAVMLVTGNLILLVPQSVVMTKMNVKLITIV